MICFPIFYIANAAAKGFISYHEGRKELSHSKGAAKYNKKILFLSTGLAISKILSLVTSTMKCSPGNRHSEVPSLVRNKVQCFPWHKQIKVLLFWHMCLFWSLAVLFFSRSLAKCSTLAHRKLSAHLRINIVKCPISARSKRSALLGPSIVNCCSLAKGTPIWKEHSK